MSWLFWLLDMLWMQNRSRHQCFLPPAFVTADAMGVAFNNANMAKVLIIGGLFAVLLPVGIRLLIGGSRAFVFYVCFLYASQEICCTT